MACLPSSAEVLSWDDIFQLHQMLHLCIILVTTLGNGKKLSRKGAEKICKCVDWIGGLLIERNWID